MNILITNFHLKDGGGHKTYINYIFDFFKEQQNRAYIASPKRSLLNNSIKKDYPNSVFDVEFPTKLNEIINLLKNIFLLNKIIKEHHIDIVHVNGSPDHKVIAAVKWLFRLNFKIIRTKHDSFKINNSFSNKKLYSKYTDHLILVSKFQKALLHEYDFLNSKTTVIRNGIDVSYFKPLKSNIALKNKLGISKNDLVMISNAGTAKHKGWLFLHSALEKISQKNRNRIKVILLGNQPDIELINKFDLQNFIFTGYIEDVREYLSISDVGFVLSYKVETISYACREMMSMGKPVIVSNFAGLPENINSYSDGWVVDVDIPDELSNLIEDMFSFDLKTYSARARKKAIDKFDINKKNDKLFSIYEYLTKQ